MAGDYTRFTFKADKNYSEVRQQQGRVSLDADWNEGAAIDDRHWRSETFDILGRCVVPATTPKAFEIVPTAPGEFTIGVGRLYLDGLQVENHGLAPRFDPILAELHGTGAVPYSASAGNPVQRFYPTAPALTMPVAERSDLIYLHVWQREVTALEDPELLDVALGGPDTTTRVQTAWQVQVLEGVGDAHCPDELEAWDAITKPSAGRLSTGAVAPGEDKPCIISPSGGYRGLENRLYRVEIHTPGPVGTAKFKWSRDNVSVRAAVDTIPALDRITVRELGRDQVLRFQVGDWVEVLDDLLEFRIRAGENVAGHMAQITAIDEGNAILTLAPALPAGLFDATDPDRHTRVQRWDQSTGVDANGLLDTAAGPLELEDGVVVSFTPDPANPAGECKRGDYWVFAARTADASVETLTEAPPRGVHHHYCRLAVVHWGATVDTTHVHDCRTIWPPAQCCTIAVRPGEDIQAAIDKVSADGGCVCLLPGLHRVHEPLLIDGRQNLTFKGVGPVSKLIYEPLDPQSTHQAALYVVGGSRDIHIADMLIYADRLPQLVVVDEDSRAIRLRGGQLINGLPGGQAVGLLLGHCCEVQVRDCRLLAAVDLAQATAAQLAAVDAELAALRPAPEEPEGEVPADDVSLPPQPRPVLPLRHFEVVASRLYFLEAGVRLLDGWEGRIADNRIQGVSRADLEPFVRPAAPAGADEFAAAVDPEAFYGKLDDALARLSPCAPPPLSADEEEGAAFHGQDEALRMERLKSGGAVLGTLLHQYQIHGNTMVARVGIQVFAGRAVHCADNHITAQKAGVYLGYAFDTEVSGSAVDAGGPDDALDQPPPTDLRKLWGRRFAIGSAAVAVFFSRGLKVHNNRLDAQTGVTTARPPKVAAKPDTVGRESLLRVLGLARLWRVTVELGWLLYQIFQQLTAAPAPAAGELSPREQYEQRLFQRFVSLLDGRYFTYFVGKAEISDNRMQVTRYGVLFNNILSIGGLKVSRNRISGHRFAGVRLHPWFSVGRVSDFAKWTRCTVEWTLALLTLLRDALEKFLAGGEGAPADKGVFGWVAVGISWFLTLCANYCGRRPGSDGEGGEAPSSPADALKDALDDFLDQRDPTWLDDLVNQAYVIDGNVVAGAGDGIVTGLDGSRISHNRVTVWPDSTVPYEMIVFALRFKARFEVSGEDSAGSGYYSEGVEMLANSALHGDRDALFLSAVAAWGWLDESDDAGNVFWEQPDFRAALRVFLANWSAQVSAGSPLLPHIQALAAGLDETGLDRNRARQGWAGILATLVWALKGYGIVMLGADMDCHHNQVESKTGCGSGRLNAALWGKQRVATAAGHDNIAGVSGQQIHTPVVFTHPALGGIWQHSNVLSWSVDSLLLLLGNTKEQETPYHWLLAFLFYWILYRVRDRHQRVNHNQVEQALVHGIRTLNLFGSDETEVMDNVVRNASRHGIYHLTGPFVDLKNAVTIKVHRNTVLHASRSSAFAGLGGKPWDFASLIWVESGELSGNQKEGGYGTALLSLNHGDGAGLTPFGDAAGNDVGSAAVYVETTVASVTTNHILCNADYAFIVDTARGLFTDNVANSGKFPVDPVIDQGPNVIV
ncbi:MAG TPA: hypothetical protein ENJ19_06290 [Gammaproteobacteria bacterium]|nr:hypothetical protein [Gammaproteobacteria bacterium]